MNCMSRVTVVIPCYNQGQFVEDAVASIRAQTFQDIEIIIVNDGSTDDYTRQLLQGYEKVQIQVLNTSNQGLASARNNGIRVAQGKYILPLDADDRIYPTYVEQAVRLLDTREGLGVVYCEAELFGAVETKWQLPKFSLSEMLLDNVIFCSALFRKSDWEAVGGYDPGMVYGWEDYDFWLSLIELGREVYQIPEILFSYRVASDSMVRSKERWQKVAMLKRIFERHEKLFADNIEVWINSLLDVREPYYTSKLYVDSGRGLSDGGCVSRKVEIGTPEIQFSLKDYTQIKAIRFDPIDAPAIVEIFKIVVKTKQGEIVEFIDYTDNSILQVGNERYFDSDDPQCFFELNQSELENIDTFTVKLSFKALEGDALHRIVKWQQRQLQALSGKLETHESSGVMRAMGRSLRQQEGEGGGQYLKRQLRLF